MPLSAAPPASAAARSGAASANKRPPPVAATGAPSEGSRGDTFGFGTAVEAKASGATCFASSASLRDSSAAAAEDAAAGPEHPSWQAKKAQSAVKPFQGKKIAFDSDED